MSAPIPIQWAEDLCNVVGHLDDQARWLRPDLAPGTACWAIMEGQRAILHFTCPCGCAQVVTIPVAPAFATHWQWDGDAALPTLTPSILCSSTCKWHGFLTKGQFITV